MSRRLFFCPRRDSPIFLPRGSPKWGIYRSLNDSANLRDEGVLFADFRIREIDTASSVPALSEWGLIALGLLVMSAAAIVIHRRETGLSTPAA